jgi:leucyl aminopeptidase (aminopeptidase T)
MNLTQSAEKILTTCMGAKPDELVLIITDTDIDPEIGEALFSASIQLNCTPLLLTMQPQRLGEEPPAPVAEAMKQADIIIAATSKSLSHKQSRLAACKIGSRTASMPGITRDMMIHGGMRADFNQIKKAAENLQGQLKGAEKIKLLTPGGTSITFDTANCNWSLDTGICHRAGCCTNLPAGEIYITPNNASGRIVVDGSISNIGKLKQPLDVTVEEGAISEARGEEAERFLEMLDGDVRGRRVAELGIGLNPEARLIGNSLEDEKVLGTAHIGFGDNSTIGGSIQSSVHIDAIVMKPAILADGREITL